MKTIINSEIIICNLSKVQDFLSRTENLVKWTHFFKLILAKRNNICRFETPIGESITTVNLIPSSTDIQIIQIKSKFSMSKKKEVASITLTKLKENLCNIKFIINPPATTSDEIIEKLSINMKKELSHLKKILEGNNNE